MSAIMDRGRESETNVYLALKKLRNEGLIKSFHPTIQHSADDKEGVDFRFGLLVNGKRVDIPLQVKSSKWNIEKFKAHPDWNIPVVNGQENPYEAIKEIINDYKGDNEMLSVVTKEQEPLTYDYTKALTRNEAYLTYLVGKVKAKLAEKGHTFKEFCTAYSVHPSAVGNIYYLKFGSNMNFKHLNLFESYAGLPLTKTDHPRRNIRGAGRGIEVDNLDLDTLKDNPETKDVIEFLGVSRSTFYYLANRYGLKGYRLGTRTRDGSYYKKPEIAVFLENVKKGVPVSRKIEIKEELRTSVRFSNNVANQEIEIVEAKEPQYIKPPEERPVEEQPAVFQANEKYSLKQGLLDQLKEIQDEKLRLTQAETKITELIELLYAGELPMPKTGSISEIKI